MSSDPAYGFESDFRERLQGELAARFDVLSDTAVDGLAADADIVVRDAESGKLILVEVKGSRASEDLPLATIPYLRRIKEAVAPNELVLVSMSPVPELVRSSLAASDVRVVEATPGEDVVPELAAAISGLGT